MKIFIGYASSHGHTQKIAERIAARVRDAGADLVLADLRTLREPIDLARFDAVALGGRVQGARYPHALMRFVRHNARALNAVPSAFFSVSLLQLSKNADEREQTMQLPGRRLHPAGWRPELVAVIGGALSWTRYWRPGRAVMKAIWKHSMENLDTTRDQIFTNWAQVDRFAGDVLELAGALERSEAEETEELPSHPAL